MSLLKHLPSPCSTASSQIPFTQLPLSTNLFFRAQNQRKTRGGQQSGFCRESLCQISKGQNLQAMVFCGAWASHWTYQSIWNIFTSQNQWHTESSFLNLCRKLQSTVMWPRESHLLLSPAKWFSAPWTSPLHQLEAHSMSRLTALTAVSTHHLCLYLLGALRKGHGHWCNATPTCVPPALFNGIASMMSYNKRDGEGDRRACKPAPCHCYAQCLTEKTTDRSQTFLRTGSKPGNPSEGTSIRSPLNPAPRCWGTRQVICELSQAPLSSRPLEYLAKLREKHVAHHVKKADHLGTIAFW